MVILLTKNYNYSEYQLTNALANACKNGNLEMVKLIVENNYYDKENINKLHKEKCTLFMLTCMNEKLNVAEYLFNHKSFNSLNTVNSDGDSVLTLCLRNINVIKYLLSKKNIIIPDESILKKYEIYRYHRSELCELRELIQSYRKNSAHVRKVCILGQNIDIYRHTVFLSDDYYKINQTNTNTCTNAARFFLMIKQLPSELLMVMMYRLNRSSLMSIPSNIFLIDIDKYINKYF